jgi:hypothetical protein
MVRLVREYRRPAGTALTDGAFYDRFSFYYR